MKVTRPDFSERILNAPYAVVSPEEAATMVKLLTMQGIDELPCRKMVVDRLVQDAAVHVNCDNWIKAEVVATLASDIEHS